MPRLLNMFTQSLTQRPSRPGSAIRRHAALCLALVMAAQASIASAQNRAADPPAQAFWKAGNRLYKAKDFAGAIIEYERAYKLVDDPRLAYNLGQCHRQLGHCDQATWFYRIYLREGAPDDKQRQTVQKYIADCETAEEARAAPPTEVIEEAPPPTSAGSSPPATLSSMELPDADVSAAPPRRRWYTDGWGWVLVGAGLATGSVGTGYLASASILRTEAGAEPDARRRHDLLDRSHSRRGIGTVLVVAGAPVVVAGVIKLVWNPSPPTRRGIEVAYGIGWIGLQGRF